VRARTVGPALACVAVATALAGVALHVANADVEGAATTYWQLGLAAAVAYGGTGGWLLRLRPGLPAAWLMLLVGLAQGVSLLALEYGVHALAVRPDLPLGTAALWLGSWLWAPAYVAVPTLLLQLLPDGHPLPGRWRAGLVLGAGDHLRRRRLVGADARTTRWTSRSTSPARPTRWASMPWPGCR
jgi:hypothetical protein